MTNTFARLALIFAPSGRASATTVMQLSGHARAHWLHAMQRSSPCSGWFRRRGRKRKRGLSSSRSFGYSTVVCGLNCSRSVTASPRNRSTRKIRFRIDGFLNLTTTGFFTGSAALIESSSSAFQRLPAEDRDRGHDHVGEGQGDQHLPADPHELVVAVTGVRRPDPQVHEDDQEDLE